MRHGNMGKEFFRKREQLGFFEGYMENGSWEVILKEKKRKSRVRGKSDKSYKKKREGNDI